MSISGEPIKKWLISENIQKFKEIANHDCYSRAAEVRELYQSMSSDEQIEFFNRLKRIKIPKVNGRGTRQLNSLLREYLSYYEER